MKQFYDTHDGRIRVSISMTYALLNRMRFCAGDGDEDGIVETLGSL